MINPAIRAIAFDAVGTLIHPDPPAAKVYAAVGRRYGSRLGVEQIRTRFRAALAEEEEIDLQQGMATSEERERRRWQKIVAKVLDDVADPAACFAELYEHFAQPAAWRCEDGTAEVLAQLRRAGHALALASNYDRRLRTVIAGHEALASIPTVVISAEIGWRKPAPAFFAHLASSLGLLPNAVLHIGDDPANDLDGARQAGMHALLFDLRCRHPELGDARLSKLDDVIQLG
jgi:putative hydrolase of the HAD superfamily